MNTFLPRSLWSRKRRKSRQFPDRSECKYAPSADSRHVIEEYINRKSIRMGDTEKEKPYKNWVEKLRRANVCLRKTSNIAIREEIRPSKAWKLEQMKMEQNVSTLFYTLFTLNYLVAHMTPGFLLLHIRSCHWFLVHPRPLPLKVGESDLQMFCLLFVYDAPFSGSNQKTCHSHMWCALMWSIMKYHSVLPFIICICWLLNVYDNVLLNILHCSKGWEK